MPKLENFEKCSKARPPSRKSNPNHTTVEHQLSIGCQQNWWFHCIHLDVPFEIIESLAVCIGHRCANIQIDGVDRWNRYG